MISSQAAERFFESKPRNGFGLECPRDQRGQAKPRPYRMNLDGRAMTLAGPARGCRDLAGLDSQRPLPQRGD